MPEKNIGLNCHDCDGEYFVTPDRAYRQECPNCFSGDVEILDELPEDFDPKR